MTEKTKILMGAYYRNNPVIAQIDEIMNYVNEDGSIKKETLNDFQETFIQEQLEACYKGYTYLQENKPEILSMTPNDFNKTFDKMIEVFAEEFHIQNYEKPNITIVKQFPHPFEKFEYKAMNFNEQQSIKFNVPKGVYLLEKYAIHGIAEIMIAHEIMHFIVGELTPLHEQLDQCPFHEEGIVDFMSLYLLLKYHFIDDSCVQNHLIFGRANCGEEYIGSLYFKESKQIAWLAKTQGIEGVKEKVRSGQTGLAELSVYENSTLPKTIEDETLNKLLSYYDFALTNFTVDTEMYYAFKNNLDIKNGKKIEELDFKKTLKEEKRKVIEKLQKNGLMYIVDDLFYNPNKQEINTMKVRLKG